MKPKNNYAGILTASSPYDRCQTPPYAVGPLINRISPRWKVWEPAVGDGILAATLRKSGFKVIGTDILTGTNFFEHTEPDVDVIITNPSYSTKYAWYDRCCALGIPFALLVPVEMLAAGTTQKINSKYNTEIEIIITDKRIDFKMPNTSWVKSNAQFPTMWLTSGLNIGQQITFASINKPSKKEKANMETEIANLLAEYGEA